VCDETESALSRLSGTGDWVEYSHQNACGRYRHSDLPIRTGRTGSVVPCALVRVVSALQGAHRAWQNYEKYRNSVGAVSCEGIRGRRSGGGVATAVAGRDPGQGGYIGAAPGPAHR
jgi:hypothetical protein